MKSKFVIYALLVSAIISGSIYAMYLQKTDIAFFELLYKGILTSYTQNVSLELVGQLLFEYIKKISLIILLGSFNMLLPVGAVAIFLIIFSYSFTTSCFILLYGIRGLGGACLLWGVQSVIVTTLSLKFLFYKLKGNEKFMEGKLKKRSAMGLVLASVGMMLICDLIGIVEWHNINKILLKM